MLCLNVFSYAFNDSGAVRTLIPARLLVLLISLVVGVVIDKWIEGHMRHLRIRSLHGVMAVLLALFTGYVVNLDGNGVRGSGIVRTEGSIPVVREVLAYDRTILRLSQNRRVI